MRWIACALLFLVGAAHAQRFEHSYALIIGNDDYSGLRIESLRNAETDARAVAQYFASQQYAVTLLLGPQQATKRGIDESVHNIAARITERDRFVFFFAGHGQTKVQEGVDVAYLVVPGGRDKSDPESLVSTGDITRYSAALDRARHQLFIFDSCYAGLMGHFRTRGANEPLPYDSEQYLMEDLSKRRVRQYLSAGGGDQQVLDNGPGELSWFTYFLRKGLEPGTATRRSSGLITFSELASYVQAYSANPKHTPAFGSLAGDGGGQFLFHSTELSRPRLAQLPDISLQTLRDMGFLTRGVPSEISADMDKMRAPIDLVFQAWQQRDVELYLRQFDRGVVQTGKLKKGGNFRRGYDEIAAKRREVFAKLEGVTVDKYEVMYQGTDTDRAKFGVRYSMNFHWKDGKISTERNINECYSVRRLVDENRWVIVRNDDYQRRICE